MKTVIASAPGNLFFLGEHAVVYNNPSINVSIGRRTHVTAKQRNDKIISVESAEFGSATGVMQNGKITERSMRSIELNPLFDLIENIASKYELETGIDLKIKSEIPVESGMSSSTAVTVSTICAISELFDLNIRNDDIFDILYPIQVAIHGGKASGSEIISSLYGGFHKITKVDGNPPIKWDLISHGDFKVVVGYTKVRAPTALTVGQHIPSLVKRNPILVDTAFHAISYLNEQMIQAIKDNDTVRMGRIMDVDHEILSKLLGLSHPKLEDCINEAKKAGALGAKLSGGGWGGVMFALVNSEDIEKVARAIESTGADVIITELGAEGVRIE